MSSQSLNRVEIDLAALKHNYKTINDLVGGATEVMGMVKSDAYGHGLVPAAQALSDAGARVFGVAEVEEGVRLREASVAGDIIVLLGAPPASFSDVVQYRLSPVVYGTDQLDELSSLAEKNTTKVGVHLKVDTGMGRLGVMPEKAVACAGEIAFRKGLSLAGLFTHYPLADADDPSLTMEQWSKFADLQEKIQRVAPGSRILHTANSAAMLRFPQTHFDMVRPGITLYGCYPSKQMADLDPAGLKPVMSFKSNVIQVKEVPAKYGLSYGHRYVTERPTRLAVLPVGYDDGYLRRLAGRAEALVRGQRVPVLGMICMNACMIDVTDIPGIVAGEEVVLMGRQGGAEISVDEIAAWSETISYEILCLFGGRNRKEFVD